MRELGGNEGILGLDKVIPRTGMRRQRSDLGMLVELKQQVPPLAIASLLLGRNDSARLRAVSGSLDEGAEQGAGGFIEVEGALGVPLHGYDEVTGGGAFEGFDNAVVGAEGDLAQALAEGGGGLVVRGVDGDCEAVSLKG